jgi:hypothetical protein
MAVFESLADLEAVLATRNRVHSGTAIESDVGWLHHSASLSLARGTEAIDSIKILSKISGPKDSEHINQKKFNGD